MRGLIEEANSGRANPAAQRSRISEFSFKTSLRSTRYECEESRIAVMGESLRSISAFDNALLPQGQLSTSCPARRSEMEPRACVRQVAAWWPYESPAPPPQLSSVLPPLSTKKPQSR